MGYVILFIAAILLFFFIAVPILKKLAALAASILQFIIGGAVLVGAIWLCIIFPPLLVPAGIFVIYAIVKEKSRNNEITKTY